MINGMQAAGVIERYAIGGAVAATFYLEPVATLDVDVFVEFHTEPGSQIISPEPIFRYLRDRGCAMEGEHGVRGRRRVDCMGRVVTRPSDREIAIQWSERDERHGRWAGLAAWEECLAVERS